MQFSRSLMVSGIQNVLCVCLHALVAPRPGAGPAHHVGHQHHHHHARQRATHDDRHHVVGPAKNIYMEAKNIFTEVKKYFTACADL